MRALQLIDAVGLENLKVVELADPKPGPHEVLVRMRAVSLNYRDLLMVGGVYGPATPLPLTPFSDGCGVVEAVGEGVTRFAPGDRVATMFFQKWLAGKPTMEGLMSALGIPMPGAGRELAVVPRGRPLQGPGLPDRPAGLDPAVRGAHRLAGAVRGRAAGAGRHGGAAGHRRRLDLRPAVRQGGRLSHHHHLLVRREAGAGQGDGGRSRDQLQDHARVGRGGAGVHRRAGRRLRHGGRRRRHAHRKPARPSP